MKIYEIYQQVSPSIVTITTFDQHGNGHEGSGIGTSYEELFTTKKGFTKVDEAKLFAETAGCDWLSVAAGSFHGAIAANTKHLKKPEARLDIEHIAALYQATGNMPLVLHGGSGIPDDQFGRCAVEGVSKFNIFTEYNMALSNAMAASLATGNKGGLKVLVDSKEACKELVKHKIRTVNPKGLRVI